MKTFIVPLDFTEASVKTAVEAGRIAAQVKDSRIILYYVYDKITAGTDGSPLADDTDARRKVMEMAFENVKAGMLQQEPSLRISYVKQEGSLLVDNLEKFAHDKQADFIVMGVADISGIEQFILGTYALDIVRKNVCPVIILPPHAAFKGVKNILFASDYNTVETTTPLASIRSVLSGFGAVVHVAHISNGNEQQELHGETVKLREMLIEYHPEFHLINETDFMAAINGLVAELDIDMIITIPRTHGFFSNLFSAGRTKMLAYQSNVPVIAIHE